jgi:hypothetical protein
MRLTQQPASREAGGSGKGRMKMSETTVVVYNHHAEVTMEWGWNTPEDIERVKENVRVSDGVTGAIVYETIPETNLFNFSSYGATVAVIEK